MGNQTMTKITLTLPEGFTSTLTANGVSLDLLDASPKGIAYLLNYGFAKSLQDKVAGLKGEMEKAEHGPETIEAALNTARTERAAAIHAGTVGTGATGPRLVGRDKLIKDVAVEHLRVYAAEKKSKMPTKAADLDAMVAKWMSNVERATRVNAEADRRLAQQGAPVDTSDLDDLLA